jgi:outer membrane protein
MMRIPKPSFLPGALLAAGLLAGVVWAPAARAAENNSRPNTVYAGVALLQIHSSSPDLSGYNTPPNHNLDVGNATTLGLGYVRDLPGPWSVELALGYPPRVRTDAAGSGWGALRGAGITDVDIVSPTLLLNYHPFGHQARWDPFVGLGINYTRFTNTKALPPLTGAQGPTQIHLSDSWGAAAHVGVVYHFTPEWSLVATIAVADVKSDLTSTSYSPVNPAVITSQAKTRINFHPVVYTLAVGYSF